MTQYIFFRKPVSEVETTVEMPPRVKLCKIGGGNSLHTLMWRLLSLGRMRIYALVDESTGRVVSRAEVMLRIFEFGFMPRGERALHIGPCVTVPDCRGRGYYPTLLRLIMADCRQEADTFYIFCSTDNHASRRGIAKAGFTAFAMGRRRRHVYVAETTI